MNIIAVGVVIIVAGFITTILSEPDCIKESNLGRKKIMALIYSARRTLLCKVGEVNVWHLSLNV